MDAGSCVGIMGTEQPDETDGFQLCCGSDH